MPTKVAKARRQLSLGPFSRGFKFVKNWTSVDVAEQGGVAYLLNLDPLPGLARGRIGMGLRGTSANIYAPGAREFRLILASEGYVSFASYDAAGGGGTACRFYSTVDLAGSFQNQATHATFNPGPGILYNGIGYVFPSTNGGLTTGYVGGYKDSVGRSDPPFGALTAVATLPAADRAWVWKDRVWAYDKYKNRVYYSKATDPTVWTSPDGGFFDMVDNYGYLNDYVIIGDSLYLFKNATTYQFVYTVDPGTDGYLRLLSDEHGAMSVVTYKAETFVLNENGLFQFRANNFTDLTPDMDWDASVPNWVTQVNNYNLCVVNEMLMVLGGVNRSFALSLRTGGWTEYKWRDDFYNAPCSKGLTINGDGSVNSNAAEGSTRHIFIGCGNGPTDRVIVSTMSETFDTYPFLDYTRQGDSYTQPTKKLVTNIFTAGMPNVGKRLFSCIMHGFNTCQGNLSIGWYTDQWAIDATTVPNGEIVTPPRLGARSTINPVALLTRGLRFKTLALSITQPKIDTVTSPAATTGEFELRNVMVDVGTTSEDFIV